MSILNQEINKFFKQRKDYQFVIESSITPEQQQDVLISHYNPARPSLIQVIGDKEAIYLQSLSIFDLWQQIETLARQNVCYLINTCNTDLPSVFMRQHHLNLLSTSLTARSVIKQIDAMFSSQYNPSEIFNGTLLVVENQGVIITGKSGSGKSQLLLSLLDRGHRWVADELTHCYINYSGEVIGKAVGELDAFAHVKHVGPVNIDKTFGLSKRLPYYPLAGIIQLGENNLSSDQRLPPYEQFLSKTILGQRFPMWQLGYEPKNPEVIIETCARQLTLMQWGQQATNELEEELEKTLCEETS